MRVLVRVQLALTLHPLLSFFHLFLLPLKLALGAIYHILHLLDPSIHLN